MRKWDERAFASPEESYFYFDKARDCLEAFYHSPYPNIDEVEKEVFTEGFLTWEKPRNGFIAKGKLDRVVLRKDNILEVIDYKTGTSLSTTEQLKASAQSLFYRTVISDCARRYSVGEVVLTYYYLETNSLVRLSYDKEEFYELWSSLSNKTKAIVSLHSLKMAWTDIEKEIAANPGSHCQYCPISATCQANRETQVLNSTRAA
jgi:RecB family exonuclease